MESRRETERRVSSEDGLVEEPPLECVDDRGEVGLAGDCGWRSNGYASNLFMVDTEAVGIVDRVRLSRKGGEWCKARVVPNPGPRRAIGGIVGSFIGDSSASFRAAMPGEGGDDDLVELGVSTGDATGDVREL